MIFSFFCNPPPLPSPLGLPPSIASSTTPNLEEEVEVFREGGPVSQHPRPPPPLQALAENEVRQLLGARLALSNLRRRHDSFWFGFCLWPRASMLPLLGFYCYLSAFWVFVTLVEVCILGCVDGGQGLGRRHILREDWQNTENSREKSSKVGKSRQNSTKVG